MIEPEGYKILEKVHEGGVSIIYRSINKEGKEVAIKVLKDKFERNRSIYFGFFREGRILFRLNHPYIIRIIEMGKSPFMVLEWIDGKNLKNLIFRKEKEISKNFFSLAWKIGEAINYLHGRGFLHNDIKPENIMVSKNGEIRLIDFGLARKKRISFLRKRRIKGTPVYIAPEVLEGQNFSEKSDIFSYGVLLYEMLTGKLPYQAESIPSLLRRKNNEKIRVNPPSFYNASVSPSLDSLIFSMICKDPKERPSVSQFLLDLGRIALGKVSEEIKWRET